MVAEEAWGSLSLETNSTSTSSATTPRPRLVSIEPEDGHLHVDVHFTGDFPGGKTGGTFDVTSRSDKIALVRTDLAE